MGTAGQDTPWRQPVAGNVRGGAMDLVRAHPAGQPDGGVVQPDVRKLRMRHMKRLLIATWALLWAAVAQQPRNPAGSAPVHKWPLVQYKGCLDYTRIHTREEYFKCQSAYIDGLIAKWQDQARPDHKLIFSGNETRAFLHAGSIAREPLETLILYIDAMHEAGAGRIDINPSPSVWTKPAPESIAKYDAAIAHIRKLGMQLSFNPTTFPGLDPSVNYAEWRRVAPRIYAELARRYKPDVFSVMHEPWSMDHRLGEHVTPQQWREFVDSTVRVVKKESPNTKCVASFLPHEVDVLQEVLKAPALDGIGLDIYHEFDDFQTFDRMIGMARDAGKFAYLAETWRTMVTFRDGTLDFDPLATAPDTQLEQLDGKWIKALTLYAVSRRLEAITVFWTSSLFAYNDGSAAGTTREFAAAAERALRCGARTPTFAAYKALAAEYGSAGNCPECAK